MINRKAEASEYSAAYKQAMKHRAPNPENMVDVQINWTLDRDWLKKDYTYHKAWGGVLGLDNFLKANGLVRCKKEDATARVWTGRLVPANGMADAYLKEKSKVHYVKPLPA